MKKPNITDGEWEIAMESISYTTIRSTSQENHHRDYLCRIDDGLNGVLEERQANAQAISAVPEMIDALIYVLECHKSGTRYILLDKIEDALKKAGVEFE